MQTATSQELTEIFAVNFLQKKFKLLIFDFDGTLVDTQEIVNQIQYQYLKEYPEFKMSLENYTEKFSGQRVETIVETLSQEKGIHFRHSPEEISKIIDDRFLTQVSGQHLSPQQGVVEFLTHSPLNRCIGSNCSLKLLKVLLKSSHLSQFFEENVFSCEMVTHPKPAPDVFLYAAQHMGVKVEDCLVIEDSVTGIQAAVKAGMQVVGFLSNASIDSSKANKLLHAGATAVVNDMCDISAYLN